MQPKYPQKEPLPKIENDLIYPDGAVELAKIVDTLNFGNTIFFLKYRKYLIIARARKEILTGDKRFSVGQFDAPLEVLHWFSEALGEFIKPSSQGGPHPGAMTSKDEDVGGEMLCLQRAMDAGNNQGGYVIVNRSRPSRLFDGYSPSEITFPENLLYQGGLLNLIKTLGEKYQRGEL